jgi:exosortase
MSQVSQAGDNPAAVVDQSSLHPGAGRPAVYALLALAILLGVAIWAYWTVLGEMAYQWQNDPQYTHGFLVPIFAVILLWLRWDRFPGTAASFCWSGSLLLVAAAAVRLLGAYYHYTWLEFLSLLPAVAGICVVICGWRGLLWALPAIGFLFFMLPLPYRLHVALAPHLQGLATRGSVYALQTLGYCAVQDGNDIIMPDVRLSVVQACSGLSMVLSFFAVSTALALIINRPLRDKVIIVLSAMPIALLVNVGRITLTGISYKAFGPKVADAIFHGLAGWLMMPAALAILGLELLVLSKLVIEEQRHDHLTLSRPKVQGRVRPAN